MAQLKTKILLLNGSQQDWLDLKDHVLSAGEPAVEFVPAIGSETNTVTAVKIKIGDGFTAYEKLPYVGEHLVPEFNAKIDELEAAIASSSNAVFQITGTDLTNIEGNSEGDKIAKYVTETLKVSANEGNIAIVAKEVAEGIPSYTAYVYTNNVWAAMDGNYDAKNIYFSKDLTYTSDIGALKLPSGATSSTYEATGKSLEALISRLMAETIAPTISQPSFTLSASASSNTTAASREIGSYITELKWDGTFTDGTYSFGYDGGTGTADKKAGCTATYAVTNTVDDQTATSCDGTFTLSDENKIQIDSTSNKTYAKITNTCTWSNSPRTPINNIGETVEGQIASASSEKTAEVKVQGYRNSFYYVGTDNVTVINSDFIRSATPRNANTTNFGIDTKTPGGATFSGVVIPANTTRVMFAVPGIYNNIAVINVDGMGLPEDGFVRTEVQVEGANGFQAETYSVFTKENANGMAATGFAVTIS